MKKGATGIEVRKLQEALKASGMPMLVDGVFGAGTERALRQFQRRFGLLPDGIAGPRTLATLNSPSGLKKERNIADLTGRLGSVAGALVRSNSPADATTAAPPSRMSISSAGLEALYSLEAQRGVSNHVYWPKGASGVTLGAGYDMKNRSRATVEADLISIGVEPSAARTMADGAGRSGADAEQFCKDHHALVDLTHEQEVSLLRRIVPQYEAKVRHGVSADLLQHEFDALVSFAYNPGGRFQNTARLINSGEVAAAMAEIGRAVTSHGATLPGLVRRRAREVELYITGRNGP